MKIITKTVRDFSEHLRPEFVFDCTKAKANPYAARLKGVAPRGRGGRTDDEAGEARSTSKLRRHHRC
jgi:hypothetical protein